MSLDDLQAQLRGALEQQFATLKQQYDEAVTRAREQARVEAEEQAAVRVAAARAEIETQMAAIVSATRAEAKQEAEAVARVQRNQLEHELQQQLEQTVQHAVNSVRRTTEMEIEALRRRLDQEVQAERERGQAALNEQRAHAERVLEDQRGEAKRAFEAQRAETERLLAERQAAAEESFNARRAEIERAVRDEMERALAEQRTASESALQAVRAELEQARAGERERAEQTAAAARAEAERAREEERRAAAQALEEERERAAAELEAVKQLLEAEIASAQGEAAAAREEADAAAAAAAQHAASAVDAAVSAAPAAAARVPEAIRHLDAAASLSHTLETLLRDSAAIAGRAALFLINGDRLKAWKAAAIPEIDAQTVESSIGGRDLLARAIQAGQAVPASADLPAPPFARLAGTAAVAVPLMINGRAVAVLYADAGGADEAGGWREAVEAVVRYASTLSALRAAMRTLDVLRGDPPAAGAGEGNGEESARRYARLLVSEIKLYNEASVRDGRQQRDLRQRLRAEIDRAQRLYEERVPPAVGARDRYFQQELVQTLADGDPTLLGN